MKFYRRKEDHTLYRRKQAWPLPFVRAILLFVTKESASSKNVPPEETTYPIDLQLKVHLATTEVETRYVEPDAPSQNGYVEPFNATFCNELLDPELLSTMLDAELLSEQYPRKNNAYRPHSGLEYLTPSGFAAQCRE